MRFIMDSLDSYKGVMQFLAQAIPEDQRFNLHGFCDSKTRNRTHIEVLKAIAQEPKLFLNSTVLHRIEFLGYERGHSAGEREAQSCARSIMEDFTQMPLQAKTTDLVLLEVMGEPYCLVKKDFTQIKELPNEHELFEGHYVWYEIIG